MPNGAAWRTWPIGARIVVRRRLPEGGYSDAVGLLVERDEQRLVVDTKRGRVEVPVSLIAIGKVITPPEPPAH